MVEKWSTDNVLSMETSVENQGLEGLKLTLDGSFNPSSGSVNHVTVGQQYIHKSTYLYHPQITANHFIGAITNKI